jgi:hypothetical protein
MLGMDDGFKRGEFIASSQAAQCALLVQLPGRGPEGGGSGEVVRSMTRIFRIFSGLG